MAVQYVGGGGFLDILGQALGLGAMFVPGLQPFAAGANLIGGIANGDPKGAVMGGLGMMKGADGEPLLGGKGGLFGSLFGGGYKPPKPSGSFYDTARDIINTEKGWNTQAPNWGEGFEPWSRSVKPQFADFGDFDDMYTNQWAGRYRR